MPTFIIPQYIVWHIFREEVKAYSPNELKFHLIQIIAKIENCCENQRESEYSESKKSRFSLEWIENNLLTTEACLDRTWEMLNSGCWKDVPRNYRYCYSLCSVIKSILLEISLINVNDKHEVVSTFKEMIQQIDKGILLGAPLPADKKLLPEIASKLNEHFLKMTKTDENSTDTIKINKQDLCTTLFPGFSSIPHFIKPSMEKFYCNIFQPKVPALIEGCIDHWPALKLWQDVEYLKRIAGNRTVPIEIGSRYTEDDWTQSLVSFSDFLKTHLLKKSERIGYLAQHELFEQIPELKNDFTTPEYCSFSDKEDNDEPPDVNAWFGPDGTVSPLHYDPKNNLLCQVFGHKRIILYSPEDNNNVYPYETRLLCNTARVDPYNPDFERFPKFQKAKGYMCFLKPGDMLFIPPKWWHHVVGLTPSFSISFWWD